MARRRLLRNKRDSNSIWDDLALGERNDTRRWFRRSVSRAFILVTSIVTAMALFVAGYFIATLITAQPNYPDVVAKARESVVEVSCENAHGAGVAVQMPLPDPFKTGIISAAHIFEKCSEGDESIVVTYKDTEYKGKLARKDPATGSVKSVENPADLALILIRETIPKLEPAPEARQGDWTLVMGHPWGKTYYATAGIVSDSDSDAYFTDASANEGNSGGPLLDSQARVLGIASRYPVMSNLHAQNPPGIYDRAEGISMFMKLKLACKHLFDGTTACPFQN